MDQEKSGRSPGWEGEDDAVEGFLPKGRFDEPSAIGRFAQGVDGPVEVNGCGLELGDDGVNHQMHAAAQGGEQCSRGTGFSGRG